MVAQTDEQFEPSGAGGAIVGTPARATWALLASVSRIPACQCLPLPQFFPSPTALGVFCAVVKLKRRLNGFQDASVQAPASQGRPAKVGLRRGQCAMVSFLPLQNAIRKAENANDVVGLIKTLIPCLDTRGNGV